MFISLAASGTSVAKSGQEKQRREAGSGKQGAGSRERGAGSREQGAGSGEQGAGSRECLALRSTNNFAIPNEPTEWLRSGTWYQLQEQRRIPGSHAGKTDVCPATKR